MTAGRVLAARHRGRFRAGAVPGFGTFTWVFLAYLYAPIAILVVFSFNETRSATVWSGFSLDWYAKAFANDDIQRAAYTSLLVAIVATGIATAVSVPAALATSRGVAIRGRSAAYGTIMLPLMVPEIVTAVATLIFFSAIGRVFGGLARRGQCDHCALGLLHSVCLPADPRAPRGHGQEPRSRCAGFCMRTSGACSARITLPLLMPGILSGAMLAFIISIDDFIITLMVAEAGTTTLPLYIYGMVRIGISPEVNAVSSVLLGFSILLVALSWLAGRRAKPHVPISGHRPDRRRDLQSVDPRRRQK